MKPKQISSWEKTRQMGAWKYGLIYGTIWGVFVVAFLYVINLFFHIDPKGMDTSKLIIMLIIYVITGIVLYRFVMWRFKEKMYQKWMDAQNNQKNLDK